MDSDDDDYGDLDDTAFLEAATQYDDHNTSFHSLPRPPPKRRKIDHSNERRTTTPFIPPRPAAALQQTTRSSSRRGPFIDSDSDEKEDLDGEEEIVDDADFEPRSRSNVAVAAVAKRASPSISDDDDASEYESTHDTSPAKSNRSKRQRKSPGHVDPESAWKKIMPKTKKDYIHTPTNVVDLTDIFQTQPPLENSPPWRTRGAIWSKPATASIGVHRPAGKEKEGNGGREGVKTTVNPGRQSISSRPKPRPPSPEVDEFDTLIDIDVINDAILDQYPDVVPVQETSNESYDPAQELADLPSDAFESNPSSPQKEDNDVAFMSEKRHRLVAPQTGLRQTTLFGRGSFSEVPASQANKRYNFVASQKNEPPTHHKLDPEAMKTWVYPINLGTIRDYQFNIVARGLFHNLLVALPTGLGKTFIAATIMLNWFRWTTEAQIVFMAPTRPLVAQQVQACFGIAGIPRSQTSMLTGGVKTGLRADEWAHKRVFFMTPQTLLNDLKSGIADPKRIVLLVVDEAHKATGSYAYTEVVSFMRRFNPSYRVLALTATPGSDVESVQKVIDGLDISRIEIRTENSLDIKTYVHKRKVETQVFDRSDEMDLCMELYTEALQPIMNKLAGLNAFWTKDPLALTPYGCTQARAKYFTDAGRSVNSGVKMMVSAIFQALASISQGMELLKYHGIRPFYTKMIEFRDSTTSGKSKYKKEICDSKSFKKLMGTLQTWVLKDEFIGHPKLDYLVQVILQHFADAAEGRNPDGAAPSETRIMVFAHWRDSAEEIVRVLKRHEPMIRPRVFVGQSNAKNSEGMQQKDQLNAIADFKKGLFNTLVATSIGEEGLDIGEVDLIICYDSKASPIRMLQRMGRTGRKREGRIILLQMKGKEENDANKAKDSYEKMQELIAEGSRFAFHDDVSRRILPREAQPVVDKRVVDIPLENSQPDFLPEPKKNGRVPKRPPKKFHMPDNVITGFVTAGNMNTEIAPKAKAAKRKSAQIYPSEELYSFPPLQEVLLDDKQTHDLARRFQTVFDDEDQPTVGPVDMCNHPARQRSLPRTHHFPRPGQATQWFAQTLRKIHTVDLDRIERFRTRQRISDREATPDRDIRVPNDGYIPDPVAPPEPVNEEAWASDDPASQPILHKAVKPRAKPGPKPKPKTTTTATNTAKPTNNAAAPKTPARRGRPPKKATAPIEPPIEALNTSPEEERVKTPRYRASEFVEEAEESSPPPTDPRMRLATQGIDLGSDDTIGSDELQDTQAYLLDSDLRDFIADENDEEVPESSLPSLDMNGLGRGTQAVVNGARDRRRKPMAKIFTSDITDDGGGGAVLSSDSSDGGEDEVLVSRRAVARKGGRTVVVGDSASERESLDDDDDEDGPVVRKVARPRRVIIDDEDDSDDD
ncbi:P-loop containing nucleoside triphosphate hydrolase protein [Aaosphaeria arxii CBS 175.79]|uniref:ATP-dependent DNA helicase n=1 Tax=Aaosphaeria arxii CBS 175.79 TaxID=1450172 RepID=A0A6A5XKP2_9PLEO|nr:P-loop containing nucleoside triphosphate hydrolase protein [Aaosphaeria arxii CBS 175.79]KAF2013411.1 P-loop containing nucleoside triphosphate hydrolase protein [Aaosphaeria arxii CBS 175.79]